MTAQAHPISLADGRTLGFSVFGDPVGVPVIALHGTPGSRLKFADSDETARRLGLKLISVDRWGYGASSPHPGGTLSDFGADVVALANDLGIERSLVTGVSGGGPYAVATATALGARALGLALVSPIGIIDQSTRLSAFHQMCFRLLPRLGFAIPAAFQLYRAGLLNAPHATVRLALSLGPAIDRRALDDAAIRQRLIDTFATGMKPGVQGAVNDMHLFGRPWGIDIATISAPSKIWIGTADRNVPQQAVSALARAIPGCEFERLPGEGHLWIARHGDAVMTWLASRTYRRDQDQRTVRPELRPEQCEPCGRSTTA